jgi:hypothetical protein
MKNDSIASSEELVKLLEYMVHHNEHHADELAQAAAGLSAEEYPQACLAIQESLKKMDEGNRALSLAIELLKEGK